MANWYKKVNGRYYYFRRKTRVVDLNEPGASLDFLGFTFRYDRDLRGRPHRYLNVSPSRKAVARAREIVRALIGSRRDALYRSLS